jgi:hypothetical protein
MEVIHLKIIQQLIKIFCRYRDITLIMFTIIPTVCILLIINSIYAQFATQAVIVTLNTLAEKQYNATMSFEENLTNQLTLLSISKAFQNFDIDEMNKNISYLTFSTPAFKQIYVFNIKGEIVSGFAYRPKQLIEAKAFQQALGGTLGISTPYRFNDDTYVDVCLPIYKDKVVVGVIYSIMSFEQVNDLMKSLNSNECIESYIVNKDGVFLTDSKHISYAAWNQTVNLDKIITAIDYSKVKPYKNYLNVNVFGTYRNLPGLNWTLIVEYEAPFAQRLGKIMLKTATLTLLLQILLLTLYFKLGNYLADLHPEYCKIEKYPFQR